jgi:hypothetical protein
MGLQQDQRVWVKVDVGPCWWNLSGGGWFMCVGRRVKRTDLFAGTVVTISLSLDGPVLQVKEVRRAITATASLPNNLVNNTRRSRKYSLVQKNETSYYKIPHQIQGGSNMTGTICV